MRGVRYFSEGITAPELNRLALRKFIKRIILLEGYSCGEVNIIFCTDDYLLKMNNAFLKHDYYTDIITFDNTIGNVVSGELYISLERVEDNAKKFDVENNIEILRVIIHGLLHLMGYKDKNLEEKKMMRVRRLDAAREKVSHLPPQNLRLILRYLTTSALILQRLPRKAGLTRL